MIIIVNFYIRGEGGGSYNLVSVSHAWSRTVASSRRGLGTRLVVTIATPTIPRLASLPP